MLLSACVTGGGAALAVSVPSFGLGPVTVPSTPTVSVPTVPTIPKAPSLPVPSPLPGGGDSGSGDSTSGGGSGSGGSGGSSGGSTGSSGGGGATAPPRPGGASGTRPGATTGPAGNGRQGNSGRPRRAGKRRRSHARSAPGIGTTRRADGRPTPNAPGYTAAPAAGLPSLGLAPQGIPNLFIDRFRIPPFLLPIYQAAGTEYGIPWQVLAAINEIETDYGRNLNISSAGAVGWMQFLPSTFRAYGVDANGDRRKDPFNPVDAIFSAARYLKAAGGDKNLRKGIFAYNHADWYVNSVLLRAKLIGGLPADLVGSLTGLTQARFPVAARASYASEIDLRQSRRRGRGDNPATLVEASRARKEIRIFARRGAAVVATQDARVVRIGRSPRLGRFVLIEDVYGNRYAYGHLGSVARSHFVPRPKPTSPAAIRRELRLPKGDPKPTRAASAGRQGHAEPAKGSGKARRKARGRRGARHHARRPALRKERLFANRAYPPARAAGSRGSAPTPPAVIGRKLLAALGLRRQDVVVRPLRKGSRVVAGTVLGRIGRQADGQAPHVLFRVRPAGRGAPLVDPSRSSTAGSSWSRRRCTASWAATRSSAPTPATRRSGRSSSSARRRCSAGC